jgi:hypothetical protein
LAHIEAEAFNVDEGKHEFGDESGLGQVTRGRLTSSSAGHAGASDVVGPEEEEEEVAAAWWGVAAF